jgi:hypothetical protein
MSLEARLYFAEKAANDMAKAIGNEQRDGKLRAMFWRDGVESRFRSIKMPVDEYLGRGNTPGTPEHAARLGVIKAVLKKAKNGMEESHESN